MPASPTGLATAFARLSTNRKLILILTLALMPLGAVALLTSLQSARSADDQRRTEVTVATTGAARKLAAELTADIVALRGAVAELDAAPDSRTPCMKLNALLVTNPLRRVPVALFGPSSTPLCASNSLIAVQRPVSPVLTETSIVVRRNGDTIDLMIWSPSGTSVAIARYRPETIARFARPGGFSLPYDMTLDVDGGTIDIAAHPDSFPIGRYETATVPAGIGDLAVSMRVAAAPFGATEALLAFLPLLMWAAAVGVGYYVVDRFLVRPLKRLRFAVGSYEPGSSRLTLSETPATEIRDLETSFAAFADRLAEREREVASAYQDQVKLTREVHHRVKNNLQVIASLISLHARGSQSGDAQLAYAAIQRRVDALAIVHRNHYAELERNLGIEVRALVSELAANFRANVGQGQTAPVVTVSSVPLTVSQDVATPLAFLITEAAEMALFAAPSAPIAIEVSAGADGKGLLSVASAGLRTTNEEPQTPSKRIVEALARQLRSELIYDRDAGRYAIEFPVIDTSETDEK